MGKKKGANKSKDGASAATASSAATPSKTPAATTTATPKDDDQLVAVVEFHHMLIGSTHKKEAAALSAAQGLVAGWIFMGGPSAAVVTATHGDLLEWLQECKRAGKPGEVTYWSLASLHSTGVFEEVNHKLKVVGYAGGKGDRMDTVAYQETLARLQIPWPLLTCPFLC